MERELNLRIIVIQPPAGIDFGLQKGKGTHYETVQVQRSGDSDLHFEFNITLKNNSKSVPDFFGSFVQGPPGSRFVYLDIGTYAGQKSTGYSRRLKIPLSIIDRETISHIIMNRDVLLEARVAGTGKDGGPTSGTIKPFSGWTMVKSSEK
jgi:hypothetical protein